MATPAVLDLALLRQNCSQCSLQQLCLPAGIDAGELSQLDRIVKRRRPMKQGDRLFRPGDRLHAVYVARDGAFKTISSNEEGEEQVLAFHLPGELMGLDALGSGVHRCETVALTTSNVCEVLLEDLTAVAQRLPGLQQQLLRVIGQSVTRDHARMEILVRRQADERIALFLHGLGERLRNIGESDTAFALPMSRADIGLFLGLALETVSRGFTRLQDDGVIAVRGRRVEIRNLAELTRRAHGAEATTARARGSRA